MAKRGRKKSSTNKTASKKSSVKSKSPETDKIEKSLKDIRIERALAENFISLQKVLTNMTSKFDKLADEMSKLLALFETSAKALVEKEFKNDEDSKEIKEIARKLGDLMNQNRIIAKGVTLLHETSMEEEYVPEDYRESINSIPQKSMMSSQTAPMTKAPGNPNPLPPSKPNPQIPTRPLFSPPSSQNKGNQTFSEGGEIHKSVTREID